MVEFLQQDRPYPSVLALGELQDCASQSFGIVADLALPQATLLAAVDVCFKAFYVFDINYPKACSPAWEFLQQTVYRIKGPESTPVTFFNTALLTLTQPYSIYYIDIFNPTTGLIFLNQ